VLFAGHALKVGSRSTVDAANISEGLPKASRRPDRCRTSARIQVSVSAPPTIMEAAANAGFPAALNGLFAAQGVLSESAK
jgi:hypothetical protein